MSGADSQWAEAIRIARGRGSAAVRSFSWVTQRSSSTSGGAPWLRNRAGMRLTGSSVEASTKQVDSTPHWLSRQLIRTYALLCVQVDHDQYCPLSADCDRVEPWAAFDRAGVILRTWVKFV